MSALMHTPFHPKRRTACDRCHGQKMRCTKAAGQSDCIRCLRLRKPCHYSPATGTAPRRRSGGPSVGSEVPHVAISGDQDMNVGGGRPVEGTNLSLTDLVQENGYELFFPPEIWSFTEHQEATTVTALPEPTVNSHLSGNADPGGHWVSNASSHRAESTSTAWNLGANPDAENDPTQDHDAKTSGKPTILEFSATLAHYSDMIPFKSATAYIQACPSHRWPPTPPDSTPRGSKFTDCLDCAAESFRVDDTFRLAEELISSQPTFLAEITHGASRPVNYNQQQQQPSSPPDEEPCQNPPLDLASAFLLISCHHRMISIWELIAGRLLYVLRKQATGQVLPSSKKTCAFLTVGQHTPAPPALEALYRAFLGELAGRLRGCVAALVDGLTLTVGTSGDCDDGIMSAQGDAVLTAARAVVSRAALYEAVVYEDRT